MFQKKTKDRRRDIKMIFVERRKGKARMYGQMILLAILIFYLVRLMFSK